MKRVEPVPRADAMACPAKGGELRLEGFDFLAKDIAAGIENARDGLVDFLAQLFIASADIEEQNLQSQPWVQRTDARKSS